MSWSAGCASGRAGGSPSAVPLYDEKGALLAVAASTWFAVDIATFAPGAARP